MARWGGRFATVAIVASILAGCGSTTPTPAANAGSSAGPQASVAGPQASGAAFSGPVATGPVDPAQVASLLGSPGSDQQAFAKQAAAIGTELRQRLNAAATYGATATTLEGLMDTTETTALQALVAKVKAATGSGTVSDASLATYRRPAGPAPAPHDTVLLTVAMLFVIVAGSAGVSQYDPKRGDVSPQTISDSETRTSGSATMDVNVSFTISSTNGVVSVSVSIDGTGQGTDSSGAGQSMSGSSTIVFTINPCPDPGGRVSGTLSIADDESFTSSGKPAIGYKITADTDFVTTVDDNADIASTDMQAKVHLTTTTAPAQPGGDPTAVDVGIGASESVGAGGAFAAGGSFNIDSTDGPAQAADVQDAGRITGTFAYGIPIMLSGFARDTWRSGRCFEVRPDSKGGDVAPGSVTPVQVKVYHWVDKADVQLPVKATLTGTKSIDPSGTPVTSPASFTFTAGQPLTNGDVNFKVTSRRGIGEATVSFKVQGGLRIDIAGTLEEGVNGLVDYHLRIAAHDLLLLVHNDGTIDIDGNATVKGNVTIGVEPCSGTINEAIPVHGVATLTGPPDAQVFHLLIGPASTSNLGGRITCPLISVPANQGDFFGQWSAAIGYVDVPVAGGTVPVSGSTSGLLTRTAKGTYTARIP